MAPWAPLPTNISSPQGLARYMNLATSNFAWTGILFAVFVIMFIGLSYRSDSKDAFITSAFICMIISILMRTLSLIAESTMNLFIILGIVGLGLILTRER